MRGFLRPANKINKPKLANTPELRFTSCLIFLGAVGEGLWVETSDYLFSCDYLFCLHALPEHPENYHAKQ